MKKLLTLLLLFICLESIAQGQKPGIRIPGQTPEQKAAKAADAYYKRQGFIRPNTVLEKNKKYYSEDNRYFLLFQEDGNLVVYKVMGNNMVKAIWNTHTNGKAVKKCVFQGDANLVLYDYNDKAIWAAIFGKQGNILDRIFPPDYFTPSNTYPVLVMQSDGNLVIYGFGGDKQTSTGANWASGTSEKN